MILYALKCRHNAILHTTQRWQWQKVNQISESEKTPHNSPSRVFIVRILEKIDRVLTAPDCIWFVDVYFLMCYTDLHSLPGEYATCTLKDLEISRFKISRPQRPILNSISYDGCYMAVLDMYRRNMIFVIDIVKKATYVWKTMHYVVSS